MPGIKRRDSSPENNRIRGSVSRSIAGSVAKETHKGVDGSETEKRKLLEKRIRKATDDIETFSMIVRMLGFLVKDAYSPQKAIQIMAMQSEGAFGRALRSASAAIDSGVGLSEAFENTKFFPSEFCSILTVGQASGYLGPALEMYGEYVEKVMTMKHSFMSALRYPTFLLALGLLMTGGVLFVLTPKILKMSADMNVKMEDLPLVSHILFAANRAAEFVGQYVTWGILVFLAYYIAFGRGREQMAKFIGIIPKVAKINNRLMWAQWLMLGAICLKSGMKVEGMLDTLGRTDLPKELSKKGLFKDIQNEVGAGHALSEELAKTKSPRVIPQMVAIAEKSGRVQDTMESISRQFLQMLSLEIKNVSTIIEPVVVGVVSAMVGSVVGAVILTIMAVSSNMNG